MINLTFVQISYLDLIVIGIGAWYWGYILTQKLGPWNMFLLFRTKVKLGGLTSCLPCFIFWISLVGMLLWYTPLRPAVVCSCIAGMALMLGSYSGASHV